MKQQDFLRDAKDRLGLTWKDFAQRLGSSEAAVKKWLASPDDESNYREMPPTVWTLVREILEHETLKTKFTKLQDKVARNS